MKEVIVVEGRYDRNTLSQVFDAVIVETAGFGVFNDREKLALLRRLAEARGLVVLTDSDGAGFVITQLPEGRHRPRAREAGLYPRRRGPASAARRRPSKEGKARRRGHERRDVLIDALRRAGATLGGRGARPPEPAA